MKILKPLGILYISLTLVFSSCKNSETQTIEKELSVNSLFSDHMVLQQQEKVAFWGTFTPNKEVKISGSWGEENSIAANDDGQWKIDLSTPAAGGPFEVTIASEDSTIILSDVLVGEVWLASGQSNMEMPLEGFLPKEPIDNYKEEVANADYTQIRYFDVGRSIAPSPEKSFTGQWNITNPETASQFSAAGYFFARKLHKELGVPIGVITSNWGGTPVESWMSKEKISALGEFEEQLKTIKEENIIKFKEWYSKFPTQEIPSTPEQWKKLNLEDKDFKKLDFDDSDWRKTNLPNVVEKLETISNNGVYWFRKRIIIDDTSSDLTLSISEGIDDMDYSFMNGEFIGNTSGWNTPRSYVIPKSILKKGENVLAIRVIDTGGGGGFAGDIALVNNSKGEKIPIIDDWRYKQIAGLQGSNFLLFYQNAEILDNPPKGIAEFKIDSHTPSVLYNGMINPLIPFNIKGAIWYQGESNVGRDKQYLKLFPGMIEDWRERWHTDFSFYFVQIAPYAYGNELSPALRDAQRKSLKTSKTGMAITMDIGLSNSIHPGNKQDVGNRLARLALAHDYGRDIVASGPLYRNHTVSGAKIIVEFDYAENGLMVKDSDLSGFEVAGKDKKFVPATAKIIGEKIEVSSNAIKKPEHVRYAWKDFIIVSLFNKDGLPASSFSTE